MPAHLTMTPAEMLELASLDALALLDEQDAALFERAFQASSPDQQREIREFQAQMVTDPALLSAEEPTELLRMRVLSHVLREVAHAPKQRRGELAPVAMIASRHGSGVVAGGESRRSPWTTMHRSVAVWQAASFALLAGLVTSLVFYSKAVTEADASLTKIARVEISDRIREALGAPPWAVMDRAEFKKSLNSPTMRETASVFADQTSGLLVVVAYGVPSSALTLKVTDRNGHLVASVPLEREGTLHAGFLRLPTVNASVMAAATFQIVDGAGNVVLS